MKPKTTVTGWITRGDVFKWDSDSQLKTPLIYKTRGRKFEYDRYGWPPLQVTITITDPLGK